MAKLKLLNTIFSKLGSLSKNNGQIIVTRDSKSLYVDLEGERIEITDWIDIDTEENLLAILTPLTNKYYYTKDTNKIWRYIGGEWKCLNDSADDLAPTYTESSTLLKLSSGEKLSVAFGKISKAITDLISHIGDSVKHITSTERTNWNSAKTHADSAHARTDATKVEKSSTNGNIKINGTETTVYTHPSGTNPHGTTKNDVGLGNVDNTKDIDKPISTKQQEKFDELNSNLDTLAFGLESGSSNIIECEDISFLANTNKEIKIFELNLKAGTYTFSWTQSTTLTSIIRNTPFYVKNSSRIYMSGSENYNLKENRYKWTFTLESDSYITMHYWCHTPSTDVTYKDFKLELGTQATPYEPYIPSVKMLAEEVSAQNDSLSDIEFLGWTVPSECPIQNYVDSDGIFHQRVGRVDLGNLEWKYKTTWFHAFLYDSKPQIDGLTKANIYCSAYDTVIWSKIGTVDKTIGVTYASDHSIGITDTSYTDATTFRNEMKGKYLYYELEEEILIKVDGNEAVTQIKNDLIDHESDTIKHITSTERTNWNSAKTHADSAHAPSNAQVNVIETIKVNGAALTPSSKAVNITVPTVGNGTVTIKQAGTSKGTFTMNQSGNTTIELTDNNTTYGVATSSALGLVKSGTDITVDSSGNVSVNDDSHNHVISNVDGLQSALDGKAPSSHKQAYTSLECTTYTSDDSTVGITPAAVKKAITEVFEPKSHTHSYAGSSSAGGSATSAVKLDSSAGSATQPVYFSGGKPVACTYTLGKSVPSNAVFTDTNTWRGIQNNLTSDSTTDSLSAAQGKVLKGLVDGKAASNHTHSQYLTSQDISGKLDNSATGADSLLSKITTSWTAIPTDNTYFIRQDTGGGNNFGRVKFSTLWSYVKGKADKVYAALTHTHTKSQITDFPTSLPANGGTSTASNYVNVNNTENKNVSRLQYFQKSGDDTIMPTKDWYSLIRCQHPGYSNGYWQDIAFPFVGGGRPQVRQNVNGTKSAWKELAYRSDIPSSLPANGGTSSYTNIINGTYTGNGGSQPPSYIESGKVRFNMMNCFKGLSSLPTFADCILMDTYAGGDVPYVTGLGIVKASGNPRAFIAVGSKGNTTTWASQAELITTANIGSQSVSNADTVDGFHASQTAGSKSTCVVTDSNGYTNLNYINSNTSNSENPSISQIIVTNGGDNYYRKASLSHLKSSLGSMPASDVYSWAKTSSKPTYTKSEVGLGNVDNTADSAKSVKSSKKLQTYKQGSTTETYGDNYPIYAQWRDSSHVKMKCDNFIVETDYATSAGSASSVAWNNISGKPSTYTPSSHTHTKSQITDFPTSLPASDVYSWAKASSKPSYSWSEITNKPSTFTPASHTHDYLPLTGGKVNGTITADDLRSVGGLTITSAYSSTASVACDWKDGSSHALILRGEDGLTSYLGWSGSSKYATVTTIRGRTCKYANSSGTSTLSDVRLKEDFRDLDIYDKFFDSIEPCAFRMKTGSSGRYHIGYKAQQIEQALIDSGLTTQDFAGFIRMPYTIDKEDIDGTKAHEEAGIKEGDDELSIIYTEFAAMNTYQIQKCKKEISNLKNEIAELKNIISKLNA